MVQTLSGIKMNRRTDKVWNTTDTITEWIERGSGDDGGCVKMKKKKDVYFVINVRTLFGRCFFIFYKKHLIRTSTAFSYTRWEEEKNEKRNKDPLWTFETALPPGSDVKINFITTVLCYIFFISLLFFVHYFLLLLVLLKSLTRGAN